MAIKLIMQSVFFCVPQLYLWDWPFFGWDFVYLTFFFFFKPNPWGSRSQSLWVVHTGCDFVAGIHPSRTWMSGTFESVRWNAYVHKLDLGLCSHTQQFWGNGIRTHVNSKGKIFSTGKIILRGGSNPQRFIKQDSEPNTLPMCCFGPCNQ